MHHNPQRGDHNARQDPPNTTTRQQIKQNTKRAPQQADTRQHNVQTVPEQSPWNDQ